MEEFKKTVEFEGKAKVGEMLGGLANIQLKPEDFSSPIALQMAISRMYEGILKAFEEGPKKKYIAEVRFTDSLGNQVSIGIDLGENPPPFSKQEVKARIIIELFEENEE
ncbi:hypothetical protein IOK49_04910 [Fervidicoccus fontis]|uniref:Uncharacterized protein n=2 Tax=Fervidicoccus fontis TaxID=683846 RepID=I0A228_FERFK|nr:hypothetical protein [Fervidicoccus fontis]AFH43035.1 hypothetical protein FFONT_1047 [Fervidicoccus fontis Kam940]MBE9391411.1 hypothetical protein [Fervidicoccus fontis]PMB75635.1 MAG: hypothetical protein C0188_02245 [Fervidicoccus fontis]PMB76555.1 MAG: hypothetical protein C0177_05620 [Fervidicoccus fontis]HEW63968.1 hypothetical protein [Fervidicoccus fontis]